jgi:hypothetical protein
MPEALVPSSGNNLPLAQCGLDPPGLYIRTIFFVNVKQGTVGYSLLLRVFDHGSFNSKNF